MTLLTPETPFEKLVAGFATLVGAVSTVAEAVENARVGPDWARAMMRHPAVMDACALLNIGPDGNPIGPRKLNAEDERRAEFRRICEALTTLHPGDRACLHLIAMVPSTSARLVTVALRATDTRAVVDETRVEAMLDTLVSRGLATKDGDTYRAHEMIRGAFEALERQG